MMVTAQYRRGAMKGKKGDRGKKGLRQRKVRKNFRKFDKNEECSNNNEYGKGSE